MFTAGQRVSITQDVDLYPHCVVAKGETGVVTEVDRDEVVVLMDRHHPGLGEWDNKVYFAVTRFRNPDLRPVASDYLE